MRKSDLIKLESDNVDEVEQALSSIVDRGDRELIPQLLVRLTSVSDPNIRNAIAIALSDLQANEAIPILLELIKDPKNKGYTGTLLYALQNLDCSGYFQDFVKILLQGNFENTEMAMELIEQYADDITYSTKVEALNFLKEQRKKIKSKQSKEPDKFDRIYYIDHALELLKD